MDQLGIFAKFWEPGKVKTRLAQAIGPLAASQVYLAFLTALLTRFANYPVPRRVLAYWPPERESEFLALATRPWQLQAQTPGDLGQRMASYFRAAFAGGARSVVLIGSDSPLLGQEVVDAAFAALREHAVVLGPSEDGGYYLVGGRRQMPDIFTGIPWSTAGVWAATTGRLAHAKCSWQRLAVHYDVDDLQDLQRLARQLDGGQLDGGQLDGGGAALRDAVVRALAGRVRGEM